MRLFAVVGPSGAGKTTLLRDLIAELSRRGRTSAAVKHCGSGFDLGGRDKDSTLLLRAGAEAVTLAGPKGTAVVRGPLRRAGDRELAAAHPGVDFVFVEGRRADAGIPTIEISGRAGKSRAPAGGRDRWILVSPRPSRSKRSVFRPEDVRAIADLVENRGRDLDRAFFSRHDPDVARALRAGVVGIAGAGGLGSNVALALARAGVGKLIIADFDRVETSNLNRQQYFADQVGRFKVEALAGLVRRIPSGTRVVARRVRVTAGNAARVFAGADVLVEAFDRADQKQMLIESWLKTHPDRPVIAASGLAGFGANNRIRERRVGPLTLIGDEAGESRDPVSPMAPRVGIVAAMQANRAVECLVKMNKRRERC